MDLSGTTSVEGGYSFRKRPSPSESPPAVKKSKPAVVPAEGRVIVGQSKVKCSDGAGLGLFAKAKEAGKVAFVAEEVVTDISGCVALRVRLDGQKDLEWLYSNGRVYCLKESPHVIWLAACRTGSDRLHVKFFGHTDFRASLLSGFSSRLILNLPV